jgi:protein-S-isoprenylcysteine O-methyltransferase Ste14
MKPRTDAAGVRVFPPLLPLVAILLGMALDHIWPIELPVEMANVFRYGVGGLIVFGSLLGLGGWSVLTMRLDGQSENPYKPTLGIIEKGPFRVTRNPMYLQMVLVCLGLAILLLNWWLLLLTPVCAWLLWRLAIAPEEAYLEAKFGDEYLAYKKRVRRWL